MVSAPAPLWFVNATEDISGLPVLCQAAESSAQLIHVLHRPRDRESVRRALPPGARFILPVELAEGALPVLAPGSEVFFLPCSERIDLSELQARPPLPHPHCLQPLFANPARVSAKSFLTGPLRWWGWRAGAELAARILREPSVWLQNGFELVEALQRWPDPPRWQSAPLHGAPSPASPAPSSSALGMSSSVLAVVSFLGCEPWLHACLSSLTAQTRPPENIVVVDDGSPVLPLELLEPFPGVTLLSTTRNVGPEKILNNIIHATAYDSYLVQDPDDWSAHDRLELSLRAAAETGAGMVGTHEFRIDCPRRNLELCVYPPDVNHALSQEIGHCLLHCTSLISRSLALKIGGLSEHLKLVADLDFVLRACHAGPIVNLPAFCLFHRIRSGSLTSHVQTGYQSPARVLEDTFTRVRAQRNAALARAGQTPDVRVQLKNPVAFKHHRGPRLRLSAPPPRGGIL